MVFSGPYISLVSKALFANIILFVSNENPSLTKLRIATGFFLAMLDSLGWYMLKKGKGLMPIHVYGQSDPVTDTNPCILVCPQVLFLI